jgi:nitrite reductase (NADH) large subunit
MKRLAIVGAGMATARLLKELANYSHGFNIDVFGEESHACYNRVLLSSVLCGEKSATDLKMLDEGSYEKQRITLHKSEKVLGIDKANKTLTTSTGKNVAWDELVIATGSRASVPVIPGIDSNNVHVFRNLNDLKGLFAAARGARKAVVIGGGLLGLEAAIGLNGLGIKTTVVNRQSRIMPRQLDEVAGGLLQEQIEYKGCACALGSSPQSL